MTLTQQQRDSIERSLGQLVRSWSSKTKEVTQKLVEYRWGDGAVAAGAMTLGEMKVTKKENRAVVSAEVRYALTRSEQDGGGLAEGHDRVELLVNPDDITAAEPVAKTFSFRWAKNWSP